MHEDSNVHQLLPSIKREKEVKEMVCLIGVSRIVKFGDARCLGGES